ncbi:MAG: hypothetical protein M3082_20985 [Candidatus Dormibacteraeota bacterium]|nr:hypothetical protein [Candidatus Dormibacteraeota bacterium]
MRGNPEMVPSHRACGIAAGDPALNPSRIGNAIQQGRRSLSGYWIGPV